MVHGHTHPWSRLAVTVFTPQKCFLMMVHIGPRNRYVSRASQIDGSIIALCEFQVVEPQVAAGEIFRIVGAITAHCNKILNGFFFAISLGKSEFHIRNNNVLHVFKIKLSTINSNITPTTIDRFVRFQLELAVDPR